MNIVSTVLMDPDIYQAAESVQSRRSAPTVIYPEILVLVDYDTFL